MNIGADLGPITCTIGGIWGFLLFFRFFLLFGLDVLFLFSYLLGMAIEPATTSNRERIDPMAMTYDLPDAVIRERIEAIRFRDVAGHGSCDFLPGDGFDKHGAPCLDKYLERLGYTVESVVESGPGQLQRVTTACGVRIARNGACIALRAGGGK